MSAGPLALSSFDALRKTYYWMDRNRFIAVMVLSVVAHFGFAIFYDTHPGVDGVIYQRIAGEILELHSLTACGAFAGSYWPPLFCYYLAGFWHLFGQSPLVFFIGNSVIAAAASLISVRFLAHAFDHRTAYWSCILLYNSMIVYFFTLYYKYELICLLLLTGCFALVIVKRPRTPYVLLSGVLLGLAALATGRVLVVVPALLLYLWQDNRSKKQRHRYIRCAVFILGIGVALAPWTVRNYYCHEKLIPITTNSGVNFYMGFNEYSDGSYMHQHDLPAPYDSLDRTNSLAFYRAGVGYILSEPVGAMKLMLRKLNLFWRIHYADTALFYPFFYVGVFLLVRRKWVQSDHVGRFFQITLLSYTVFHMLFISRYYYVIPVLPMVYGIAIRSQYALVSRLRKKAIARQLKTT